jgi:hypothetical protein
VVIAGLTDETPWSSDVALSRPYLVTRAGFGVPPVLPVPESWKGQRVAVDPERIRLLAFVREEQAIPEPHGAGEALPAAGYDFELAARGLQPVGPKLPEERHVIATVPGENAFLLALDRFLRQHDEAEMRRVAAEHARR